MSRRKRATSTPRKKEVVPPTAPPRAVPTYQKFVLPVVLVGILAVGGFFATQLLRKSRRDFANVLAPGAAAEHHVVIITVDTTRADRLGCYGYAAAETPVMDRLAAEGVRFDQAISPVPITLPAHVSMFTGLDPHRHGVRHNGEFIVDPALTTLAEVLQGQGYDTAAFVSSFVLDARFGLNQGFDVYDAEVDPSRGEFGGLENERSAEAVTTAALRWLAQRSPDRPFFLWVHYYDPHHPYEPPPRFKGRFQYLYDAEVAYMDEQIGRLLSGVADRSGARSTLTLLAGDHGESLGEHDEDTHSRTLYDATQRVPLILHVPSRLRGPYVVDDVVVGLVDIFPTVLDLLGLPVPEPIEGISLLRSREQRDRHIYMETLATYLVNGWAPLHAVRRLGDKYIEAPRPEYYDMASDPHELRNLHRAESTATQLTISEVRDLLHAQMAGAPSPAEAAASASDLDPEARRRLESLGYLSSDRPTPVDGELPDPKDMLPVFKLIAEAKRLTEIRQFEEALAKGRAAFALAPGDPTIPKQIGVTYLNMGKPDLAIEPLKQSLAIKPTANVLLLLAQIMIQKGELADAAELLEQSWALDPNQGAAALIARGDLLAVQGFFDAAIASYEEAIRNDPHRAKGVAEARIARIKSVRATSGAP